MRTRYQRPRNGLFQGILLLSPFVWPGDCIENLRRRLSTEFREMCKSREISTTPTQASKGTCVRQMSIIKTA